MQTVSIGFETWKRSSTVEKKKKKKKKRTVLSSEASVSPRHCVSICSWKVSHSASSVCVIFKWWWRQTQLLIWLLYACFGVLATTLRIWSYAHIIDWFCLTSSDVPSTYNEPYRKHQPLVLVTAKYKVRDKICQPGRNVVVTASCDDRRR